MIYNNVGQCTFSLWWVDIGVVCSCAPSLVIFVGLCKILHSLNLSMIIQFTQAVNAVWSVFLNEDNSKRKGRTASIACSHGHQANCIRSLWDGQQLLTEKAGAAEHSAICIADTNASGLTAEAYKNLTTATRLPPSRSVHTAQLALGTCHVPLSHWSPSIGSISVCICVSACMSCANSSEYKCR